MLFKIYGCRLLKMQDNKSFKNSIAHLANVAGPSSWIFFLFPLDLDLDLNIFQNHKYRLKKQR